MKKGTKSYYEYSINKDWINVEAAHIEKLWLNLAIGESYSD